MNFAELWMPLMAAVTLALGTLKLAAIMAAWLPWSLLALVACSSAALGYSFARLREVDNAAGALMQLAQIASASTVETAKWSSQTAGAFDQPLRLPASRRLPRTVSVNTRFPEAHRGRVVLNDLSPHQEACLVVLDTAFIHARGALHSNRSRTNMRELRDLLDAIRRFPAAVRGDLSDDEDVLDSLAAYDQRDRESGGPDGRLSFRPFGGLRTIYGKAFDQHAARYAQLAPLSWKEAAHDRSGC